MARPTGKAARRRARQRKAHSSTRPQARPLPSPAPESPDVETQTSNFSPPAAVESRTTPEQARPEARRERRVTGSSRLSAAATSEYHYVGRELRSIASLSAVVLFLLFVAWAVFNALGLIAT